MKTYKITARFMKGTEVIGYSLTDNLGNNYNISKEETHKLALEERIINVKAQEWEGKIILKGVGEKLNELPVIDTEKGTVRKPRNRNKRQMIRTRIVARIFKGKSVVGYLLQDEIGNEFPVRREEAMVLAKEGRVENARVQKNRGDTIIRGVGCDLAQLPTIKI